MKRITYVSLIIIAMMIGSISAIGQVTDHAPHESREKIESMRVAFITTRLSLSTEEAEKFWPVYNEYLKEKRELHIATRKAMRDAKEDHPDASDEQIEARIQNMFSLQQKELDVKKKYHGEFLQVLSIRKVGALYKAEEDFKRELVKRMADKPHHGGGMHH